MKNLKFNFKSIVRHKARWLLTIFAILTIGVGQMWGTLSFNGANNGVKFSKSFDNGANYYDHEIKHGTTNSTQDVGTVTNLYLKEYFVQLYQDEDNYTGTTHVYYWFYKTSSGRPGGSATSYSGNWGDWGSWNGEGKRYPKFGNNNISDDGGSTNVNLLYGQGAGEYTFEYYFDAECKNGWAPVVCSNGGSNFKATFTVPGFTDAPANKSFGTSIPVNTESETTISFNHYGTALTTSNCVLSGTNRTMFVVRSISESGVTVSFSPGSSTGDKTATLTITDAHSKSCSIILNATVVAKGSTTQLYFNDYKYDGAGDWAASSALYRFTVAYTDGVYTHYPMTLCSNTEHTYSANIEFKSKTATIDRYNPSSPYETWNSATPSPALSASKPYAKSKAINTAYAADHPYNDVTGGTIYYDNSQSGFTSTVYLIVGREYVVSTGSAGNYTSGYALTNITNTKLYYGTPSQTWHDATFYAFIGASSAPGTGGNWGTGSLSTKANGNGYSAAYTGLFGLLSGSTYLGSAPSKTGGALSMTKTPTLTTTQTFNYALSTDGGSSFDPMTSDSPNTPGKLSMAAYEFTNAKCTTVVAKSAQELAANATTYTKAVSSVALAGATTLTESNTRSGYTFVGWYDGSTLMTASEGTKSCTYYPNANKTITARYKAHRYTINFNVNDAQYPGTISSGTTTSVSNVVYDQSATLTTCGFHRIGYKFAGWSTSADGSVAYADGATAIFNLTTTDGGSATLYAQWTEDNKTFKEGVTSSWTTSDSWAGGVPSNDYSSVTINGEVTLSSYAHIGELSFGENGKLNITSTGALEVVGTIDNEDASKIVINTTSSSQGALIYDISSAPHATVNLTTENTGSGFQFIASPIGNVSVSDYFAGSGVYTYAWIEGKGWDHRGYYEDFSGDEVIVLSGAMSGCTFAGRLNPTTGGTLTCRSGEGYNANAEGVNMIPNTLTAPIKIAEMTLTNSNDGSVHIYNNGSWGHYPTASAGSAVIPALQGYAVIASAAGSVSFDYTTAVRGAASHNDALKAPQRTTADIQDHITISVTTDERKIDMKLYENELFSNAMDNGWEALYMEGDGRFGELYAHATEPMSILATDNLEGTVLGFAPGQAENYTISFEGDGKGYYLNDVQMEVSTLIEEGNIYEFAADESTNATRFVISKTPIHKVPTGVDAISDGAKARKQLIDGVLYVIRDGRLYNTTGALVK